MVEHMILKCKCIKEYYAFCHSHNYLIIGHHSAPSTSLLLDDLSILLANVSVNVIFVTLICLFRKHLNHIDSCQSEQYHIQYFQSILKSSIALLFACI